MIFDAYKTHDLTEDMDDDVYGAEDDDALDAEIDQDLADLEHELEGEAYGADAAPVHERGDDAPLQATDQGNGLIRAFDPDTLLLGPDHWVRQFLANNLAGRVVEPDIYKEARDLRNHLIRTSGFAEWVANPAGTSPGRKGQILDEAIFLSAFPGNYPDAIPRFIRVVTDAWSAGGVWEAIKSAPKGYVEAFKTFWASDVWPGIKSIFPVSDEQALNSLAIAYWSGKAFADKLRTAGKAVGVLSDEAKKWVFATAGVLDKYEEIIGAIDAAIAAGTVRPVGVVAAPETSFESVDVQEDWALEQVAPPSGFTMPRPQTILAIGYGLMAVGTGLRFFK